MQPIMSNAGVVGLSASELFQYLSSCRYVRKEAATILKGVYTVRLFIHQIVLLSFRCHFESILFGLSLQSAACPNRKECNNNSHMCSIKLNLNFYSFFLLFLLLFT